MQTAHELFLHGLSDMLDAERRLVEALGEQAEGATNPQLQKAFLAHQVQTEKQVQRIELVFEQLGEQPEETECKGLKGLLEEVESFKEEDPSEDILDVFSIAAAMKVESYEMNGYESLIRLATEMEHTKAVKLLTQNLKEEQAAWKKLDGLAKKIKPERTGHEEAEVEAEDEGAEQPRRRGGRAA